MSAAMAVALEEGALYRTLCIDRFLLPLSCGGASTCQPATKSRLLQTRRAGSSRIATGGAKHVPPDLSQTRLNAE